MTAWSYDEHRPDVWTWLQAWYVEQCDGDWEHGEGIRIETLDSPGWIVTISLAGTTLEALPPLPRNEMHRSEDDWSEIWVEKQTFRAACGPLNLAQVLHEFRVWATSTGSSGSK